MKRIGVIGCLAVLLEYCAQALALDPSLDLSQYSHTAWKIEDGSLKGAVRAIAQTPDGYLWLGTESGLFRFDGVRFTAWESAAGQNLPSSDIRSLVTARDGTLWIGTLEGLASWKDGKLTPYSEFRGQNILSLLEDVDGTVWAGTFGTPNGKLGAIHHGKVECYGADGIFGQSIYSIYQDRRGRLWVGATSGLWQWKPDPPNHYALPQRVSFESSQALAEGENNAEVIAACGGLRQLVGERIEDYPLPATPWPFTPLRLLRDHDGGLWIGTLDRGLLRVFEGKICFFDQSDNLSSNRVLSFFEDREHNMWVGTADGLDRFREFAIPSISARQGLSSVGVMSVLAARDGSIWLGTLDCLNRWKNGRVTIYRSPNDAATGAPPTKTIAQRPPSSPFLGGVAQTVTEMVDPGLPDNRVGSLFEDDAGRIWVSTIQDIGRFENGRFSAAAELPGGWVNAITGDGSGGVWISYQDHGLFHWANGKVTEKFPWSKFKGDVIASAVTPDPVRGGLWLGFFQGGLAYFKNGEVRNSYGQNEGLGRGRVTGIHLGEDGGVWAATAGGLSRLKDGRISTLTTANGLPCDTVHWVMPTNDGSVWLYTACGLLSVPRQELEKWAADPGRTIIFRVFGNSDGVRSHPVLTGYTPRVTKAADGRVWFVHFESVSVIDPSHLWLNPLPPPVQIEAITANGKTFKPVHKLRLPPRVKEFSIEYTALSLAAPENVHFRYKLEGQDPDWKEVVNQRRAQYSNLPPGNYRFRVVANNNSGVWNDAGTSLEFRIAPTHYQTGWFRALCVIALLGLFWAFYQARVRHLRRDETRLRHVVKEQTAQLTKANDDLQFVNKELEAFSYSVSHDLRAPLRHIVGFAELLQKQAEPQLDDKSRRCLCAIADAAQRMSNMIEDLLDFSRLGRGETEQTAVNLDQLVKDVVRDLEPDTNGRDITWRIGSLPTCYGDPAMFRIFFTNLISNAVKFTRTRAKAEIEIASANRTDGEVVVFVRDNGVGFDMNYKQKLFGVFQRLHSREAFEGTGIGLATVQRIVHRHGGAVWAEGAVDKGATFYVALPNEKLKS